MHLEQYVESIIRKLPCSKKEKANIKDELYDHVLSLKEEFMQEGADEETATMLAMQRFGDSGRIAAEISASLPLFDPHRRGWFMAAFVGYLASMVYVLFLSPSRWNTHRHIIEWKQKMMAYGLPEYTKLNQNTIPLRTLWGYAANYDHYNATTILYNTAGNVLLFVPLGFLLPLLYPAFATIHRVFFASLSTSLVLEFIQLLFSMGSFDVDDILLNTVGALCGYGLARIWMNQRKRFTANERQTNIEGSP